MREARAPLFNFSVRDSRPPGLGLSPFGRLIFRSKKKNDRVDAEKLAKLIYLGEVPTVHVPSPEVRA